MGAWSKLAVLIPAAAPAGERARSFSIPHATSSSHLKWEERGGGNAFFSSCTEFILTADRLQSWGEDKQRSRVRIFQNLPVSSSPLHFPSYLVRGGALPGLPPLHAASERWSLWPWFPCSSWELQTPAEAVSQAGPENSDRCLAFSNQVSPGPWPLG